MASDFLHRMRVEFSDTDMAGIVHFSRFFHYMEVTEHAFLRSLGLPVHSEIGGRLISWPRGQVNCSYKAPLRFGDEFDVRLSVNEIKRCTITYAFHFVKHGTEVVAEGSVTAICVELDSIAGAMEAVPIPKQFLDSIKVDSSEANVL